MRSSAHSAGQLWGGGDAVPLTAVWPQCRRQVPHGRQGGMFSGLDRVL